MMAAGTSAGCVTGTDRVDGAGCGWTAVRRPGVVRCGVCALLLGIAGTSVAGQTQREPSLDGWLDSAEQGLTALKGMTDAGLEAGGTQAVLRIYLDDFEALELWYGPGAPYGKEPLASAVTRGEALFHDAMRAQGVPALRELVDDVLAQVRAIRSAAADTDVPAVPRQEDLGALMVAGPAAVGLRTVEMRAVASLLGQARLAYAAGRGEEALRLVEEAYLQDFEPIEARLPGPLTREIESLIHIRLRPMLARNASVDDVGPVFDALAAGVTRADDALAEDSSFWFGTANAFAIIVREGLEAVLLIAAILAYLTGAGAARRHRRRIWIGAGVGVAASFGTWALARTLLPVSGASREMLEGVTAVLAVVVLLYVSHWLFQKTYIHDWKQYLKERVGIAVTTGSGLAMASLAFAAVYREGFETVLFYQALMFDTSSGAVLAGFVPGLLVITGVGAGILRLGMKLPLKQLFTVTNTILLLLAFVFLGKGIYNLQEAGLFAPHPLAWAPDQDWLRQVLGIYPLAETLIAQLALLGALAFTLVLYRRRSVVAARAANVARESAASGHAAQRPIEAS